MARDEHTKFDKTWKQETVRLDIPVKSVVNLRRVASELRALALRFDALSRDPSDASDVLHEAWTAARHTRANLGKIRSPGRPKKRIDAQRVRGAYRRECLAEKFSAFGDLRDRVVERYRRVTSGVSACLVVNNLNNIAG